MIIKLFCAICGRKLNRKKLSSYFDRFSGKQFFTFFQECPDYQIGHDKIEENSEKYREIERFYLDQKKRERLLKIKRNKK